MTKIRKIIILFFLSFVFFTSLGSIFLVVNIKTIHMSENKMSVLSDFT